ncbi:MAG: N-acetyltransferase [Alphaproteobacteria bacterium]|nr:N-acetyltransferase [Alphaproteobacteria bacterium]
MGDVEPPTLTVKAMGTIADIGAPAWDACAGADHPFVSYAFLDSLERSGSANAESGWAPYHLLVEEAGRPVACAPMYLKGHSYGEYVFDWAWAEAFERAGGRYYPKLLIGVPFTPVPGPRLLAAPGPRSDERRRALVAGATQIATKLGVSSLHVNFATEPEWRFMTERGFLARTGEQFHWFNEGYRSFDDFLAALSSAKRKAIRKERRAAVGEDLAIVRLSGRSITEADWDAFFQFYMDTGSRKWGTPYLTRAFFSLVGETMAERIVLILAKRGGRAIAGALNFVGRDTLYGRYWGEREYRKFLHFEVCYYQAIEHAIETGLARVEAGAQGPHKLARGYRPVPTYSAHWIENASFRAAVDQFLARERRAVAHDIEALAEHTPFRKTGAPPLATIASATPTPARAAKTTEDDHGQ